MPKNTAEYLRKRYQTNNPFEIADQLGILVVFVSLEAETHGLFQRYKKSSIIYINDSLPEQNKKLVCAHELGHAVLHKGLNRVFMDAHTLMVPGKFEKAAWRFAVDLLWTDADLQEYREWTIPQIANYLGIPEELAEYRMLSVIPKLY